jgi:hypothetical protein
VVLYFGDALKKKKRLAHLHVPNLHLARIIQARSVIQLYKNSHILCSQIENLSEIHQHYLTLVYFFYQHIVAHLSISEDGFHPMPLTG